TVTAGSNSPVCQGATLNLTASAGGVAYNWSGPNGFLSSVQNPSISNIPLAGAGTYTVQLTDANGCSQTATRAITVTALPAATATTSTGDLCLSETISLLATGGGTYSWAGPSSFSSNSASVTRTNATLAMSGVYTVTVTGATG